MKTRFRFFYPVLMLFLSTATGWSEDLNPITTTDAPGGQSARNASKTETALKTTFKRLFGISLPRKELDYSFMVKAISSGGTLILELMRGDPYYEMYRFSPDIERGEGTQQGVSISYKYLTFGYSGSSNGRNIFLTYDFGNNRVEGYYQDFERYIGTYYGEISGNWDKKESEFNNVAYDDLKSNNIGFAYLHTFFSNDFLLAINNTLSDPRFVLTPFIGIKGSYLSLSNPSNTEYFGVDDNRIFNDSQSYNLCSRIGLSLIVPIWKFYSYLAIEVNHFISASMIEDQWRFGDGSFPSGYLGFGLSAKHIFFALNFYQLSNSYEFGHSSSSGNIIRSINGQFEAKLGFKF